MIYNYAFCLDLKFKNTQIVVDEVRGIM